MNKTLNISRLLDILGTKREEKKRFPILSLSLLYLIEYVARARRALVGTGASSLGGCGRRRRRVKSRETTTRTTKRKKKENADE